VATDSNTELVEWLLGIATTVSLALAGRSFQIHEGFDERLRKLEQNMISRQDLKDTMQDFQITVQRQEDRFRDQMEEIKKMIGRMDNKLEKHFDEERDRDKRNR
jgi:biopolymer transport protein ExbB/TolQ